MRHYVLTRAVYGPDWEPEANRRRLLLTRLVTVPSMAAQTSGAWRWIVLLHRDDPYREEREAAFRLGGAPVTFIDYEPREPGEVPARVAAMGYRADWRGAIEERPQATLTTRLDDDDAFVPDALERIRRAANTNPRWRYRVVWMLPEGFRVWDGRYQPVRHERNAWATLQAPVSDDAVIYDFNHKRIGDDLEVRMIDDRPGWLWVRHPDTLSRHRVADRPIDAALRSHFPSIDWRGLEPATAAA